MASYRLSAFADEADAQLSEQLSALSAAGIYQIEMRGVNGKSVAELSDAEAREARRMLDGAGVTISSMGSPFGKYPIEQPLIRHLDALKRGLEICGILGARRIRMFSFFIPEGKDAASYKNQVMDGLKAMLDCAREAGIHLAHENEKGIYGDVSLRCQEIMEAFGSEMGFIFDPANFIQCGEEPMNAFPRMKDWIEYMHIKDALMDGGAVVPAGMGDGSIRELLDELAAPGTDMTLTLEPHLQVFDGLNGLQTEEVRHKYSYPNKKAAFFAAADALKALLKQLHFTEGGNGVWIR